jgi:hypothetical protein
MLTKRDIEVLEYEALSILEATWQGPLFLSAENDKDELLEADINNFDKSKYAAEVQLAIKNLRNFKHNLKVR